MPELQQEKSEKSFQRQIAYKVKISDVLNGIFTRDEFSAGYITLNGSNVSRVNLLATVVYKLEEGLNFTNIVVDDGSGRIPLRTFESNHLLSKVDVGDIVLSIGRIREFNNEKYIVPEILKKIINAGWLNVRKLELSKRDVISESLTDNKDSATEIPNGIDEEIYVAIRNLDSGDGASFDDVIGKVSSKDAEIMIKKLLEKGDIFEIKPGKLKVLE